MATHDFLEYEQPGGVFYACVLSAAAIVNRLDIRRRSADEEVGIQRDEDVSRVREIATYLRRPSAVLPTPIIVSAYDRMVSIKGGEIVLSDEQGNVGHILDGQHRILGLRLLDQEELNRIDLLVVFVFEIEPFAQATIFTTINSNQKQVSKSLIYDLFGLDPKRSLQKTAHEVAKSLNDDSGSPFYARIKLLGKKVQDTETLSQAAFVDRLLDAIKEKGSLFGHLYSRQEDWAIRKIMGNAFAGLQRALAEVPNNYSPDFFLKTTGYGGVMKSMNPILNWGRDRNSLKEDVFFSVFSRFLQEFPAPPQGTGNAAMLVIRRNLEATLLLL